MKVFNWYLILKNHLQKNALRNTVWIHFQGFIPEPPESQEPCEDCKLRTSVIWIRIKIYNFILKHKFLTLDPAPKLCMNIQNFTNISTYEFFFQILKKKETKNEWPKKEQSPLF